MSVDKKIDKFISFFEDQLVAIESMDAPKSIASHVFDTKLYRIILYVSLMDCLSGIRYPELRDSGRHKDKFIKLIDEYSSWDKKDFVSVPILKERLKFIKGFTKVKRNIKKILEQCKGYYGRTIGIDEVDKHIDVFLPLTKNKLELRLLEETRHKYLFYKYRNFVIHEFRQPGYAMGTFGEGSKEPIYHGYIGKNTWVLLYPVGFFQKVAECSVCNLKRYFKKNRINPYDHVRRTSDWFDVRDIDKIKRAT